MRSQAQIEHLRRVQSAKKGIPRNPEHIAKMVTTRKQRGNFTVPHHVRDAVGKASRERKRTDAEKAKISAALRGRKRDPEIGKKSSATRLANRTAPYPEKRQKDPRYKPWRLAVLERDCYKCKRCGFQDLGNHAHHLLGWKDFPALRYDVNNAITLCDSCHAITHHELRRIERGKV